MTKPITLLIDKADSILLGSHSGIEDYQDAIEIYEQAASMGSALAFNRLGKLFFKGENVKPNYKKAIQYFKKSISMRCFENANLLVLSYIYTNNIISAKHVLDYLIRETPNNKDLIILCSTLLISRGFELSDLAIGYLETQKSTQIFNAYSEYYRELEEVKSPQVKLEEFWDGIINELNICFNLSRYPEKTSEWKQIFENCKNKVREKKLEPQSFQKIIDHAKSFWETKNYDEEIPDFNWRIANIFYGFIFSLEPKVITESYISYLCAIANPLFNLKKARFFAYDYQGKDFKDVRYFAMHTLNDAIEYAGELESFHGKPLFDNIGKLKDYLLIYAEEEAIKKFYMNCSSLESGFFSFQLTIDTIDKCDFLDIEEKRLQIKELFDRTKNVYVEDMINLIDEDFVNSMEEIYLYSEEYSPQDTEEILAALIQAITLMTDLKYWQMNEPMVVKYGVST